MSINYGKFIFAAAPRTGTTWWLKSAAIAGLGNGSKSHVHQPAFDRHSNTLSVTLVRHPCDWLASYYVAIHRGCSGVLAVDKFMPLSDKSFDCFVEDYLTIMPGYVGRLIDSYRADTVFKIEDMPWAFVEFAESLGVSIEKRKEVASLTKMNASKELPVWDKGLRRAVKQVESDLCERYEYL